MDPTPNWLLQPQLHHRPYAPSPPPPQFHYPYPSYYGDPNPSYTNPNPTETMAAAATHYIPNPYDPYGEYSVGTGTSLGGNAVYGVLLGYPKFVIFIKTPKKSSIFTNKRQSTTKTFICYKREIKVEKYKASMLHQRKTVDSKEEKNKEAISEHLEMKKIKIIEEGATPEGVKICTICNTVMNS